MHKICYLHERWIGCPTCTINSFAFTFNTVAILEPEQCPRGSENNSYDYTEDLSIS